MFTQKPEELSEKIDINCYCCSSRSATHLCRFRLGELPVQVCLCETCMQLDTAELFEKTLGLSYLEDYSLLSSAGALPV